MIGPVRAVAIDDEPAHLLSITAGLSAIGIPCMGYWYDRDVSELRPEPPEGGLPFVRIVFTDLNLDELGGVPETPALWAVVVTILKRILSKNSGPYLLVFWTRVGAKAAEVKEMLYARANELEGLPCPIDVLELPKAKFLTEPPKAAGFNDGLREFYAALHANIEQLRIAVAGAAAANANLNAVAAWESRAAEAAAEAVNEVYRCARSDDLEPPKTNGSFAKVIAKIAAAASGEVAARADPARALDAGMMDILIDQFGSSVDLPAYKSTVSAAIGASLGAEIVFENKVATYAELNTFFHVDRVLGAAKSWDRGVVVRARPPLDGNALGFRPNDLLISEFLFPHELFAQDQHEKIRDELRWLRDSAPFVLVEVGADCDHAQDHQRTRRFLVGLEIPEDLVHLADPKADGKLRNGALELLGPWKLDGSVKYLLVSCRRFWTWQRNRPPPGDAVYRLRASLVDKLLHRYSAWSSRPGIVEFK